VPELAAAITQSSKNTVEFDEVDNVHSDDVSLVALASPMAGIVRDGSSDYS